MGGWSYASCLGPVAKVRGAADFAHRSKVLFALSVSLSSGSVLKSLVFKMSAVSRGTRGCSREFQ